MHFNKRTQHYLAWGLLVGISFARLASAQDTSPHRPNFLWILSEDNSKHFLKLFDPDGASTPHIERLAAHGLIYERAFSCSPVCSVARTTLMSGVYAPRLGTHYHRKIKPASLPEDWNLFPAFLRQHGYYTSNRSKTDYNTAGQEGVWDESSRQASWRRRPRPEVPFLHMETFTTTHESSLHFTRAELTSQGTVTSPEKVRLAPYHPDTELFRATYARYHDRIRDMDRQVGRLVEQLERDGLLENTFIFYFGDHGGVLPGSKGYLRETGLHVPLVVRIPEKWKHLVDGPLGARLRGFVSFVDFGPTVLHLASVPIPSYLDGRPFLGLGITRTSVEARREAFGYADRFDEKYEMVRSWRVGRFKYVRHYQGYLPDSLQNNYRYRMLAYEEWRSLHRAGRLSPPQNEFFAAKPPESLYDVETDPYEIHDLAREPAFQEKLAELRSGLTTTLAELPDLGFYPEHFLVDEVLAAPIRFGKEHTEDIAAMINVANLALRPFDQAQASIEEALRSENPWIRGWALMVASQFGREALPLASAARKGLNDRNDYVRVRAAEFLGGIGESDPRPTLLDVLSTTDSPTLALIALNTVVYLQDGPHAWKFEITAKEIKARNGEVERRLEYLAQPPSIR